MSKLCQFAAVNAEHGTLKRSVGGFHSFVTAMILAVVCSGCTTTQTQRQEHSTDDKQEAKIRNLIEQLVFKHAISTISQSRRPSGELRAAMVTDVVSEPAQSLNLGNRPVEQPGNQAPDSPES